MGCASSAPLVEQGKHLVEEVKETANDTMAKGEKALHGKRPKKLPQHPHYTDTKPLEASFDSPKGARESPNTIVAQNFFLFLS